MATLLDGVEEDTTGTGASHSGPCTVFVSGDLGGGEVSLDIAPSDTAGKYVPAGRASTITQPGSYTVDALGTYFLRARLSRSTGADVTVETTQ
jgi:hypothetical protein